MASPELNPPDTIDLTAPSGDIEDTPSGDLGMVACIRRFIQVNSRLDAITAEEKVLKREKAELSARVIEMMIEEGMDSPPGVDGMTAYLNPVFFVEKNIDPDTGEAFTSDDIRDALVASNLSGMLKESYNGNQLRALIKEYEEHGSMPEPLAKVVRLSKRRELAITPMAARKQSAAPRFQG